jgi:DNA-binding transcriptional LysR family regulator
MSGLSFDSTRDDRYVVGGRGLLGLRIFGMELRQVRYFVAIAETGSYTRATDVLTIAQPSLSQQIAKLEDELGTKLFDRTARGIVLTAAGAAFLIEARSMLDLAERARMSARWAGQGKTGTLTLGYTRSTPFDLLTDLVTRYIERSPAVVLQFREVSSLQQTEELLAGRIDAGIHRVTTRSAAGGEIEHLTIRHEQLHIAIATKDERFAARDSVTLKELADIDFIFFPRDNGEPFHDDLVEICRNAGFEPNIAYTVSEMRLILGLVAAGLGCTMVPNAMARLAFPGIHFMRQEPPESLEFVLAWSNARSVPTLQGLLAGAREIAAHADL